MAGINPYSLNPNQMSNQMMNGMTSPQNVMPISNNPQNAQLTSSYSTLQNQQAIQNQQANGAVVGQPMTYGAPQINGNATSGIIANQMRSRTAPVAPATQQQSGMQLQPQKGIQPGQASANASPKMTVY
jgi:hypothetical protein